MIPRLQAEEMLAGVHVAALGGGNLKANDMRQEIARLQAATGRRPARPKRGARPDFGALGIGARTVPAKGATDAR